MNCSCPRVESKKQYRHLRLEGKMAANNLENLDPKTDQKLRSVHNTIDVRPHYLRLLVPLERIQAQKIAKLSLTPSLTLFLSRIAFLRLSSQYRNSKIARNSSRNTLALLKRCIQPLRVRKSDSSARRGFFFLFGDPKWPLSFLVGRCSLSTPRFRHAPKKKIR